jgi:hypothetical protein
MEALAINSLRLTNILILFYSVLKTAHQLGLPRMKEFCFHFIVKNYNDVVANKDGVKDLGIE